MAIPFRDRRQVTGLTHGEPTRVASARGREELVDFVRCYERYHEAIYRFCRRRLRDDDLAEDAAAQTFANALAGWPRFRGDEAMLRSWLFTIAYHVVADHHRGDHDDEPLEASGDLLDEARSIEEQVADADAEDRLLALLAELPGDQRGVVELRLSGFKGAEIAAVMHRSHDAVRMLQHRAAQNLARLRARQLEP
jgi:RNA polymerase sigma-70 factor (ECF subfamily)